MTAKKLALQILFTLMFVIIIDLVISIFISGFTFKPQNSAINNYLSYGFSIENKLLVLNGTNNDDAHNIAKAGWIHNDSKNEQIDKPCAPSVSIYGMSFTNRIANELKELKKCIPIRQFGGPAAPLNHSFASYRFNKATDDSEYIVLGILASSLPKLHTVSHFNSAFEFPSASMYPRYTIENEELIEISPLYSNLDSFRNALLQQEPKNQLKVHLSKYDVFYNEFVFESSIFDYSNIGRMLRRSYAQKHKNNIIKNYFESGNFLNVDGTVEISRRIIRSFIEEVTTSGKRPIIILLNDRGYANSLDNIFVPMLNSMNVSFISSSTVIDSEDLNNFEGDGHFTKDNDILLARELIELIDDNAVTKN